MRIILLLLLAACPVQGETLVAARRLPAQTILSREDLAFGEEHLAGGFDNPDDLIGMETRVTLYPQQPVMAEHIGQAALVERNALVRLEYRSGNLVIEAEGRALGRGALGEMVRVMNLASKAMLSGRVAANGHILLGEP